VDDNTNSKRENKTAPAHTMKAYG